MKTSLASNQTTPASTLRRAELIASDSRSDFDSLDDSDQQFGEPITRVGRAASMNYATQL